MMLSPRVSNAKGQHRDAIRQTLHPKALHRTGCRWTSSRACIIPPAPRRPPYGKLADLLLRFLTR